MTLNCHKIFDVFYLNEYTGMISTYGIHPEIHGMKRIKEFKYIIPDNPNLIYKVICKSKVFAYEFKEGYCILRNGFVNNIMTDLPFDFMVVDYIPIINTDYIVVCFDLSKALKLKEMGINVCCYAHDSFADKSYFKVIQGIYKKVLICIASDIEFVKYMKEEYGVDNLIIRDKFWRNANLMYGFDRDHLMNQINNLSNNKH
jgi:hypothetical protein